MQDSEFTYTKAYRENVNILIGLAGASGSGKTYSAMLLAQALGQGRPFRFGDTEGDRGLHYADQFDFEHVPIKPPFHPKQFLDFIRETVARGFRCAVIDSTSHEWAGEGGILDMAAADPAKSPSNWIKPKAEHKKFVNGFLAAGINIIFCLRAHEKIRMEKDPNNPRRQVVIPMGWQPVAEKEFMYEMTISMTMDPKQPGIVNPELVHKCADQFKPLFMPGNYISAESGSGLAAWARGGEIVFADRELWMRAREAANRGTIGLRDLRYSLSEDEAARLRPIGQELNRTARMADQNMLADIEKPSEQDSNEPPPADEPPGDDGPYDPDPEDGRPDGALI